MQFIGCAEIVQMIEGNTSQPHLVRRRKASRGPRTMARAEALHRDLRGLSGRHAVVRGRNGKQTKVEANDVQPERSQMRP